MKILVIDDEVEVANLLADAVRLDGHEPVVAHRGDAGLAAVTRDRPDAVFLDVVMPDMSGLEVLRQIRSRDASLPVVLITGRAGEEQLEEAQRLGVSEVVEKPEVLKHLTEAVKALQARRRKGNPGRLRASGPDRVRSRGAGRPVAPGALGE